MARHSTQRRGITSVLAMLFLVLFSVLAIGFYAATSMGVQIANNERHTELAQAAAESGMQFVRYELAELSIPHNTPPAQLFDTACDQLVLKLKDTGNLGSMGLGRGTDGVTGAPNIIIPANDGYGQPRYITIDGSSSQFRAVLTQSGQQLAVKVTGRSSATEIRRAIQMNYGIAQRASGIFGYGVASNGKITTSGSSIITGNPDPTRGSVLSACLSDSTPVSIGGQQVSGDISIVNPNGNITYSGASIGGTSDPVEIAKNHLHKGVDPPEFPTVDTSAFAPFGLNKYTGGESLDNCYIPPNTNPRFTGNCTIKGVLYVQTPNTLTFKGNTTIQGCIVVQNNPTGSLSQNVIDFGGNVTVSGVETLPASYGDLRKLTGAFILAPGFDVSFTGSFGTVNGSIIASKISMTGNAGGTVNGSVINLNDLPMAIGGSSDIIIGNTGTTNYPAGVFFGSNYVPLADTYQEVQP